MVYVRSLIYFLSLILTTTLYSIALVIVGPALAFEKRCKIANSWGTLNLRLLKLVCGLEYRIEGIEHVAAQNCVVMSKHQSAWETIALRGLLPPPQSWVLKKELLSVPFFGWALRRCQPIAIDRKAGRRAVRQVIDQGKAALESGRWVIVFPEGTRVAPGVRKKYGIGGALLAEKSKFPVVPIAHNAGEFWKRRGFKKYPGTIEVVVGPPIMAEGKKASQIIKEVEEWIENKMLMLNEKNTSHPNLTAD